MFYPSTDVEQHEPSPAKTSSSFAEYSRTRWLRAIHKHHSFVYVINIFESLNPFSPNFPSITGPAIWAYLQRTISCIHLQFSMSKLLWTLHFLLCNLIHPSAYITSYQLIKMLPRQSLVAKQLPDPVLPSLVVSLFWYLSNCFTASTVPSSFKQAIIIHILGGGTLTRHKLYVKLQTFVSFFSFH